MSRRCVSHSIRFRQVLTEVYDIDLLHKYARAFPQSPLTDFIDDYCRWFHLPLPEPDEEEADNKSTPGTEDKQKKSKNWRQNRRNKAALNARERRKARRLAGREGALAEDIDQEERDHLVAGMTVSVLTYRPYLATSLSAEIVGSTPKVDVCASCHGEDLYPGRGLGERYRLCGQGPKLAEIPGDRARHVTTWVRLLSWY